MRNKEIIKEMQEFESHKSRVVIQNSYLKI